MSFVPLISIIIPTYNRARYLPATLASIQSQTFEQWECLIIDDGSDDNTLNVIKPFLKDARFKYFKRPKNKPKGANSCRNFGLQKSICQFIHWMDSDDILHPQGYEISMKYFNAEYFDFFSFKRTLFYSESDLNFKSITNTIDSFQEIDSNDLEDILKNQLSLNTCNVIWKKTSLGKETFNESIVYADEWEYYSRLLTKSLKGKQVTETLLYARKHPDSTTYEFSKKDEKRISSKKKAIILVASNLRQKNFLSDGIQQYLINQAIGFRDFDLMRKLLKIKPLKSMRQYGVYLGYPMWKLMKRKLR
jgi:GalNAc5-diNAcBac-PP-undecaprenol beta-1,3-glucosyltransferase